MGIVDVPSFNVAARVDTPKGFAVTPGKLDADHGSDAPPRENWASTLDSPLLSAVAGVTGTMGAAFRQNNVVASAMSAEDKDHRQWDFNYKPYDDVKGSRYEPHWERFIDARNQKHADAIKRQIDQETDDKRTLEGLPWYARMPAELIAGTLDLPTLIPGGAFIKSTKGGFSIARSAVATGIGAGAGAAIQEAGLHASQETRTIAESGVNVAGSVLLGGMIGAGGAKLLSHLEWRKSAADLATANRVMGEPAEDVAIGYHGSPNAKNLTELKASEGGELGAGLYFSRDKEVAQGYSRVGDLTGNEGTLDLKIAGANLKEVTREEFLAARSALYADEQAKNGGVWSREVAARAERRLIEDYQAQGYHGIYDVKERQGVIFPDHVGKATIDRGTIARGETTPYTPEQAAAATGGHPSSIGAAALEPHGLEQTAISGAVAGGVAKVSRRLNSAQRLSQSESPVTRDVAGNLFEMSSYTRGNESGVASPIAAETLRKEWDGGLMNAVRATRDHYASYRKGGGDLSRTEFENEVGRAMRRDDKHAVPEVARAAQAWRSQVFDPLKEAAIKAKLLPEDVGVDTAASYFSRMWRRGALIAQEPEFKQVVSNYYSNLIKKEFEASATNYNKRVAQLEQEAADLTLTPEQRATTLRELETAKTLHEATRFELSEQADRLSDLAGDLRTAKSDLADRKITEAAYNAKVEAVKAERAEITKAGGQDLRDFLEQRTTLNRRERHVEFGNAGLQERSERALSQLADIEEANQRSMERLVAKGQKLEKDLDRLDADALEERITQLAENYGAIARKAEQSAERANKTIEGIKERGAKAEAHAKRVREREVAKEARSPENYSLLEFLASQGGLKPDPELKAIVDKNPFIPGRGYLFRKNGMTLDRAREAAVLDKYLVDNDVTGVMAENVQSTSTVRDLLDAIDAEARGQKQYKLGREPERRQDRASELHDINQALDHALEDAGFKASEVPDNVRDRAVAILDREGTIDPLDAYERAVMEPSKAEVKVQARLEKEADYQSKLAERMDAVAQRLEAARNLDHDAVMAEIKSAIDKVTRETSSASLERGARAGRLGEKLEALDPKRIEDRLKAIDAVKKDMERRFYDRWEIRSLGEAIDPANKAAARFDDHAKEVADEVFNKLTGRASEGVRPEFISITSRGPMKERTFNIPDELVEPWLESNAVEVGRRYQRVMSSDVELANKFGSPDMKDALAKVDSSYDRLRQGITDPKELTRINAAQVEDKKHLAAVRDIIRGIYGQGNASADYAYMFRIAASAEYVLKMGSVVLSSLTEPVRVVAAKGLLPFMRDGFNALSNIKALKLSIEEARLAGNINDKILAHRLSTLADLSDVYGSRGPVEKFMDNATNVASSWNGIRMWTDAGKSLASTLIQNQILKGVSDFAGAGAKTRKYLAFLGIDEGMAERIGKQFAEHGENMGGVHVAKTEAWTDDVAVRIYRAALNKDLDSMVVTRGAADLPLFAHSPIGRIILQFNTFNLASHQRILMRGLQEGGARFVGTVAAMTTMGMLQTYLAALAGNRMSKLPNMAEDPGWWLSEGLDRSGVFSVPFQIANGVEKLTGFNPVKAPMKMFDQGNSQSARMANRNELGAVLGPAAGTLQDIGAVAGISKTLAEGKDVTQGQKNAATRLVPFNSYFGVRQMLNYVVNPPN